MSIYTVAPSIPSGSKTISYSQFSLYSECPWKWKLMYVDGNRPSNQSIHLTFGSSMHETLQHYLTVAYNDSVKEADRINLGDLLYERLVFNYKKSLSENGGIQYTNRLEMDEFFRDGVEILDFIKKRRAEYFPTKNHKLLGIETPLLHQIDGFDVYLKGFIDLVMLDESENRIIIYDFKTSTRGWGDKEKKNEIKKSQIIIYKEYFAKQFDLDVDHIDVVFFILKRKLFENSDFAQKRVQLFKPPSGKNTRKKVNDKLVDFVNKSFTKSGQFKTDVEHYAIAGDMDKNCKWCIFKDDHKLCPPANRLYY